MSISLEKSVNFHEMRELQKQKGKVKDRLWLMINNITENKRKIRML